jgi:XTP/dITP diphosphohydrolase
LKEIVLATNNRGKIAELQAILSPTICISQDSLGIEPAAETGLSFIENALIKARAASRMANKPALADDSGLVVPSLNGAPGIYSARFAGENASDADNIRLLLQRLENRPSSDRSAFFYCAIALVQHANDPMPIIACGQWSGMINTEPSGNQGFGYDPIFYLPDYQCTAAELPSQVKNSISHRAKALAQLQIIL